VMCTSKDLTTIAKIIKEKNNEIESFNKWNEWNKHFTYKLFDDFFIKKMFPHWTTYVILGMPCIPNSLIGKFLWCAPPLWTFKFPWKHH
jgi:hypothetical protein